MCSMGLLGVILGVLAWQWGANDLQEMYAGRMDRSGKSLTNVGRILGIVGVCLVGVWTVVGCGCGILGVGVRR